MDAVGFLGGVPLPVRAMAAHVRLGDGRIQDASVADVACRGFSCLKAVAEIVVSRSRLGMRSETPVGAPDQEANGYLSNDMSAPRS